MTRTATAWRVADIPDQKGRTVVVTGPTTGGLGHYVGPGGLGQYGGAPQVVGRTPLARNAQAAARLWEISEEAVGLAYP